MSLGLLKEWGVVRKTFALQANYIETKQSTYHPGAEYRFPQIVRQEKWALEFNMVHRCSGKGLNASEQCKVELGLNGSRH